MFFSLCWLRELSEHYSLVEDRTLLLGAHSGQKWNVSHAAHSGTGSGREGTPLFPLMGKGFAPVTRWRNPRGRIRDHHKSSRQASLSTLDRKEMAKGDDPSNAGSQVVPDLKGARPEPTGFEPAIFCVTGRHVRPLHHGSLYVLDAVFWVLSTSYVAEMIPDKRFPVKSLKVPISKQVKNRWCEGAWLRLDTLTPTTSHAPGKPGYYALTFVPR
jgi:hypothetical protein